MSIFTALYSALSVLQFKMKLETQTKDRIPNSFMESFRKTKINVVTKGVTKTKRSNFFSPSPILKTLLTSLGLTLLLAEKSLSSNKTQLENCGRVSNKVDVGESFFIRHIFP